MSAAMDVAGYADGGRGRAARVLHMALVCALTLAWSASCSSLDAASADAEADADVAAVGAMLEDAQRAVPAFEAARARGDAEAMARAAMLRIPFDAVQVGIGDAAAGLDMPTGQRMLAEAREAGSGDAALLARIDAIATQRRSGLLVDHFNRASGTLRPDGVVDAELPRRPVSAVPFGRYFSVRARDALRLRTLLPARQSLIVYAQAPRGGAMTLSVRDDTGRVRCEDAQVHGALICRWRSERPVQVVVELRNADARVSRVFVSTNL